MVEWKQAEQLCSARFHKPELPSEQPSEDLFLMVPTIVEEVLTLAVKQPSVGGELVEGSWYAVSQKKHCFPDYISDWDYDPERIVGRDLYKWKQLLPQVPELTMEEQSWIAIAERYNYLAGKVASWNREGRLNQPDSAGIIRQDGSPGEEVAQHAYDKLSYTLVWSTDARTYVLRCYRKAVCRRKYKRIVFSCTDGEPQFSVGSFWGEELVSLDPSARPELVWEKLIPFDTTDSATRTVVRLVTSNYDPSAGEGERFSHLETKTCSGPEVFREELAYRRYAIPAWITQALEDYSWDKPQDQQKGDHHDRNMFKAFARFPVEGWFCLCYQRSPMPTKVVQRERSFGSVTRSYDETVIDYDGYVSLYEQEEAEHKRGPVHLPVRYESTFNTSYRWSEDILSLDGISEQTRKSLHETGLRGFVETRRQSILQGWWPVSNSDIRTPADDTFTSFGITTEIKWRYLQRWKEDVLYQFADTGEVTHVWLYLESYAGSLPCAWMDTEFIEPGELIAWCAGVTSVAVYLLSAEPILAQYQEVVSQMWDARHRRHVRYQSDLDRRIDQLVDQFNSDTVQYFKVEVEWAQNRAGHNSVGTLEMWQKIAAIEKLIVEIQSVISEIEQCALISEIEQSVAPSQSGGDRTRRDRRDSPPEESSAGSAGNTLGDFFKLAGLIDGEKKKRR
jgi:hypothetical protein